MEEQGIAGPAPARPLCRRCNHARHLGRCYTKSVFPAAVAHLAPQGAVEGDRGEHLAGTLIAECGCEGTMT